MRRILLTGFALAVLAGCGGSGDGGTVTTAPTAAKAKYIAKADSICVRSRAGFERLTTEVRNVGVARSLGSADQAHHLADLVNHVADYLDKTVAELQALPKPTGDEQVLGTLYSTVSAQATDYRHLADAADSLDAGRASASAEAVRAEGERARGIATGYGFTVCAQD